MIIARRDEVLFCSRRLVLGVVPSHAVDTRGTPASSDAYAAVFCPECGYDLRATAELRCPECGSAFDRESITRSQLPWAHRRHVGRVRAYWKTVWIGAFEVPRLATEISRPVRFSDASWFRWVTVAVAALTPALILLAACIANGGTGFLDMGWTGYGNPASLFPPPSAPIQLDPVLPFQAGITRWATLPIAGALFALFLSGVQSYWFHPRSLPAVQQNRAVALSYYVAAPLAYSGLPIGLLAAAIWTNATGNTETKPQFRIFAMLLTAGSVLAATILFAIWLNALRLLRRVLQATGARMLSLAVGLPLSWIAGAVISFYVFPWLVGFVWLMYDSLR
jgi:hypothetical protein